MSVTLLDFLGRPRESSSPQLVQSCCILELMSLVRLASISDWGGASVNPSSLEWDLPEAESQDVSLYKDEISQLVGFD